MRTLIVAAIFSLFLAAFCSPLAAQNALPIYLYSRWRNNGAGAPPLHVFSVNSSTGVLSEVPGSPFAVGSSPCCIAVDPTGRFVYIANSNSNDINAFSVSASTGTLTALPGSPSLTGNNPGRWLLIRREDSCMCLHYTYDLRRTQSSNIYAYSIDSVTGVLTPLAGSPFAESNIIQSITFDPDGELRFLSPGRRRTDPGLFG